MLPWIAAVLLGALAPALVVAGLSANLMLLPLAFAVTLGHSVVLGLPAALFCRAKRWTRFSAAIVGALLIGAIPVGIFGWPMHPSWRTSASVDGVPTIIDGVPTLAGWVEYLNLVAEFGALGATGGVMFWLTLKFSGLLTASDARSTRPLLGQSRIGILLAGVAVSASVAIAALPSITRDRSCHNMFRDGRTSVSPKVRIDLDIAIDDWPMLARILKDFGGAHGMSFRNASEDRPGVKILGLSVCSEQGLVITADELLWASRTYAPPAAGMGVPIGVFDLNDGIGWRPLAQELVGALDSAWQGKVRFRDGSGRFVPDSTALGPQSDSPRGR